MLKYWEKISRAFSQREDGVTALEYALIAALVAIVMIGGLTTFGTTLQSLFTKVANSV